MKNVFYKYDYPGRHDAKMLRRWFKKNELDAIQEVAYDIAPIIGKDCYLIPIPNKDGHAIQTLNLANWLAMDHPRIKVFDIMKGAGRNPESESNFFLTGPVPEGKRIFLLDNVIETGLTAAEALKLIPSADVVVHSIDRKIFDHSSYKSLFAGVYRCEGNLKKIFEIADKSSNMKIELKNVKVYAGMSEETTAFVADLYINDYKAGQAKNDGRGGTTFCQAYNTEGFELMQKAEAYCKALPPKIISSLHPAGEPFTVAMSLDSYVDDLLLKSICEKAMKKGIVFGTSYGKYSIMEFNFPLDTILKDPKGQDFLRKQIIEITSQLTEGQRILNTNLPEEILQAANIQDQKAGLKNTSPDKKKIPPGQKHKPSARKQRPK